MSDSTHGTTTSMRPSRTSKLLCKTTAGEGEHSVMCIFAWKHSQGVVVSPFLSWILPPYLPVMLDGASEVSLRIVRVSLRLPPPSRAVQGLPGNVMRLALVPHGACVRVGHKRGEDGALVHLSSRNSCCDLEEHAENSDGKDESLGKGGRLGEHCCESCR